MTGLSTPAGKRPIRIGGLFRCCTETIRHSIEPTEVGSIHVCPHCGATVVVNRAGEWQWAADPE